MAAKRDYYEVLGVAKTADADQIKSAYRKLARKFHPDVNKDADAAKKFGEVQEAYDILTDPAKREAYNQFGHAGVQSGAGASAGPRGPRSGGAGRSADVGADFDMDSEDLGSMFEAFFGGRGPGRAGPRGSSRARSHQAPADDIRHAISVSFMTAAKGGTENVRVTIDGKTRSIEVKIPPGTADGAQLRVRGGASSDNGPADLILAIRVGGHPIFRRGESGSAPASGLDLYLDLPLTVAEAMLGTTVSVPTLDGRVELSVPGGTASGKKLRLKGKGIGDVSGKQGDLYAIVQVTFPPESSLTSEERDMLRQVAAKTPSPRTGPGWDL